MQLTIEKCVLNIKLRHRPVANRGDIKKSAHSGHMSHMSKSLIIVTTLLLLKATSHHPIGNRIPWRRLHVNLLMQLTIEKCVLNIKLRHRAVANRGDSKKSAHSGHMSHRSKSLIIVTALLLGKATSHKTRFIVLKRSIRVGLNFVYPLARDGMNTERGRDKIPGASALKRSNLLSHGKLPFGMTLSIPIRSWLEGNIKTILTRRVTIRWTTMKSRKRRGNLIKRRSHIRRRRRDIRGSIRNSRTPRIMKGKRRQRRGGWTVRRGRRRTRW
jgi:hypothetical protein